MLKERLASSLLIFLLGGKGCNNSLRRIVIFLPYFLSLTSRCRFIKASKFSLEIYLQRGKDLSVGPSFERLFSGNYSGTVIWQYSTCFVEEFQQPMLRFTFYYHKIFHQPNLEIIRSIAYRTLKIKIFFDLFMHETFKDLVLAKYSRLCKIKPHNTDIYNRLQMSAQVIKEDSDIMINAPEGYHAPIFNWDPKLTSPKLKLDESLLTCTSTQGSGFKTTVGTERFNAGGKYYFELFINKGQLLKVGVCRPTPINLEEAFCDTLAGWGIYNGETRHNSNSTGPKYGSQLQAGDILGIAVDMVDGKLEYFQNGASWGVAFTDAELAQGQLVAAVSPIYVNDVFTLRTMIKQD